MIINFKSRTFSVKASLWLMALWNFALKTSHWQVEPTWTVIQWYGFLWWKDFTPVCLWFFGVKILFASNLLVHVHVSAIHCFHFFSRLFLLYVMMHFFMLALWDSILCSQTILSLALLMRVPSLPTNFCSFHWQTLIMWYASHIQGL